MKKYLLLLILLIVVMIFFASCSVGTGNGSTDSNASGNNGGTADDAKAGIATVIRNDTDIDVNDIRYGIESITGSLPRIVTDSEPQTDGELVLGDSTRSVTSLAKARLEEELSKTDEYDCGYIIFVDGDNIAVYWQLPDMQQLAIADLIKVCFDEKQLELDDGIAAYGYYNRTEYEINKYWLAIEAVADSDVVTALRALNSYFDGSSIVDFYANLWDGEYGGFYYTVSARDSAGFLPDMESTVQIIKGLKTNGAYDDINSAYPTEIKEKILAFAMSTQSSADGYFYHPQWPTDKSQLQSDRYGRDMGHATDLIAMFNIDTDGDGVEDEQYLLYCAPNGVKCALHTGSDEKCSFPVSVGYYCDRMSSSTVSLTVGSDAAVARLLSNVDAVASTVSSQPDYSSREAFSAWLEAYNSTVKENSGKAHNLSAIRDEITQYGYDDIVLDHLDRVQEEVYNEQMKNGETPTGLWQRNVDYNAVWGLLKYSGYTTLQKVTEER